MSPGRMIVVSNRLPITIERAEGKPKLRPSAGGLVTALTPILKEAGGCWVGWTGCGYEPLLTQVLNNWAAAHRYALHPVFLTAGEKDAFYTGCSNQIIWPLFHGFASLCRYDSAYWRSYRAVNEKFARAAQAVWRTGDAIWVQDYHLMLAGQFMRRQGFRSRIAYFHHIPFPAADAFEALPWRAELLFGLIHYDVIGFQTTRDVRNFASCLLRFLPDVRITPSGNNVLVSTRELAANAGAYPISIDFDEFDAGDGPETSATAEAIAAGANGAKVVLGVDRLDYTKGILQRLKAFGKLLDEHEEWRGRVTMFQIVIPSREDIPEYRRLRLDIEMLVSEINGRFGAPAWTPIHFFHRSIGREELLGFYRSADVALVTPLRDGMNLVAKEFCAARRDERGVLVLSEFTGAAEELGIGALLVNPNDTDGLASTLYAALSTDDTEQQERMQAMRFQIRRHDVFQWASSFARDAAGFAPAAEAAALRVAGD